MHSKGLQIVQLQTQFKLLTIHAFNSMFPVILRIIGIDDSEFTPIEYYFYLSNLLYSFEGRHIPVSCISMLKSSRWDNSTT